MEIDIMIGEIVLIFLLSVLLILIYIRVVHNWSISDFLEIRPKYSEYDKNVRIGNYIKDIRKQPEDRQKKIFTDISLLFIGMFIILVLGMKSIFFADVVSQSMVPTFDKNDLILIQNIDRTYHVGDIIFFDRYDTSLPVSHRIISIGEDGIRTAGDATKVTDWWILKNEDIKGKAVTFGGKPLVIKGLGKFFTVEDRNQRFGPFDYQGYGLFLTVVKAYGYVIAVFSLLIYIFLSFGNNKDKRKIKSE
jgi:signal peptidase I